MTVFMHKLLYSASMHSGYLHVHTHANELSSTFAVDPDQSEACDTTTSTPRPLAGTAL